jgi:hypothetical protein
VNGDGFADVIAGSGAGAPAQVRVFSGFNRAVLNDFYINDPFNPGLRSSAIGAGVRVAVADADGDGLADVITGEADGPRVNLFYGKNLKNGLPGDDLELTPFSTPMNGVFVG